MKKRNNIAPLKNLIYHTEQEAWKNMSPEHRGYRTALWKLLSDKMFSVGDYYVPADELFFGTTVMADQVLERILEEYNFKNPKTIMVKQPRYDDNRAPDVMSIPDYLAQHATEETIHIPGEKWYVVITEDTDKFVVTIL